MQTGGPIAFYEIAATLIPFFLLGGVVLDATRPEEEEHVDGEVAPERNKPRSMKTFLMAYQLPIAGVSIILVELIALDAIVNKHTDIAHALVVGIGLIIGMLAVVFVVWIPWAKEMYGDTYGKLMLGYSAFVSVAALVSVLIFGSVFPSRSGFFGLFRDLASENSSDHKSSGLPPSIPSIIWLEHLIATSDYRIDKLRAEGRYAPKRAALHLPTQTYVQRQECKELFRAIEHDSSEASTDRVLPPACQRYRQR